MKQEFKIKRRTEKSDAAKPVMNAKPVKQVKLIKPAKQVKRDEQAKPVHSNRAQKKRSTSSGNTPTSNRGFKVIEGGKSPRRIKLRFILIGVVLLLTVSLVSTHFLLPTGIIEFVKVSLALSASGDGYPVSFSSGVAKGMSTGGDSLVVLTDTDLKCYNKNGAEVYSRLHGFANPIVRTSQMRTLTFDRDGTQYRIDSADRLICSGKSEYKISGGDICRKGVYALVTDSEKDVAQVTVYNSSDREIYRCYSSQNYISSASLSENGSFLCVVSVNADNAMLSSKLAIYSLKQTEPLFTKDYNNELISITDGGSGDSFTVISDKYCRRITSSGNVAEYPFNDRVLTKYELLGDRTLLCLSSDQNSAQTNVIILDKGCKANVDFSLTKTVNSISASGNDVYIISGALEHYSGTGELIKSENVDTGAFSVKSYHGKAAVLYGQGIKLI